MLKYIKKFSIKTGAPPGTPIHTGEKKVDDIIVTLLKYNDSGCEEEQITVTEKNAPEQIKKILNSSLVSNRTDTGFNCWINVKGLHNVELDKGIADKFGIHSLSLEDILNTGIRPKIEDFDDYLLFVLNSFHINKDDYEIIPDQISLILLKNCVISFQESGALSFNSVIERIKNRKGRVTKKGADYLAYRLIDLIVDNYFLIFEHIAEEIDSIEEDILNNADREIQRRIHRFKRDVLVLKKSILPLREMIRSLSPDETPLIDDSISPYIRDVNDHVMQIIDIIESISEMLLNIHDMHMSNMSNKMNEVMKTLTIIATIFIPLTFIVGIYGMNFQYMPELGWRWGYFILLGIMGAIGLSMIIFFKRKKWF